MYLRFNHFLRRHANVSGILTLLILAASYQRADAQIVNVEKERIRNQDSVRIMGKVSMNVEAIQNKSLLINAGLNPHLQYKNKKHLVLMVGQAQYAALDGKMINNGGFLHLRYNYAVHPHVKAECFTQLQYNRIWNMPLRFLLGAGPRFKLLDIKKSRFYFGPLYMYEIQQFDSGYTQYNHRLSAYLSWNIELNQLVFFSGTVYYQPLLSDFSNYRISGLCELNIAVSSHFTFENKLSLIFDQTRTADIPARTYQYTAGIGYKF